MRSISRRAGWSTVAKKSGSPTATRSTGICRRANQTRTAAGMRSSVRMLWNSSATISIVARSTGVVAACFSACLRWCSSSSSAGVLTARRPAAAAARRRAPAAARCPACASVIAARSAGDAGARLLRCRRTRAAGGRPAGSAGRAPPRRGRRRAPGRRRASSAAFRRRPRARGRRRAGAGSRTRRAAHAGRRAEAAPAGCRRAPPLRERRMNGRRSTSGSTRCSISQRLVSW